MTATIRKFLFRKPLAPVQNIEGRYYLVTGASKKSIGYATTISLLKMGAFVTITKRKKAASLVSDITTDFPEFKDKIQGFDLELSDDESIYNFVNWYKSSEKPLDVLINNAGIHLDLLSKWKEPKFSNEGDEIHWRTNYLGTITVVGGLLPLLLQRGSETNDARIVNVVSTLHKKGRNDEFFESKRPYNSWEAYGQSKLALVHLTKSIQKRYEKVGLTSYCLHPGEVYTNIASKGLVESSMITFFRNLLAPLERLLLMTKEEGAQTSIYCATNPKAVGGAYYVGCKVAPSSIDSCDEEVADALWNEHQDRLMM